MSTPTTIHRPIWRKFSPKYLDRAAAWVREGGHAAVEKTTKWGDVKRIDLLLGVDEEGVITEQGEWALLAVELEAHEIVEGGLAKGLARAKCKPQYEEAVLEWCERDAEHVGPTREMALDCLACGSCCHDSNVILFKSDLKRFKKAGRNDLLKKKHIKHKKGGKMVLRFPKHGPCQQLRKNLMCRIYEIRPFNCRVFPVGTEACLAARELTRGWRDDEQAPPLGHSL